MVPVHPPRGENSNIVRVYLSNLRGNANPISNYAATKRWSVSVHICSPEGTDPTPIFSRVSKLLGPPNFVNSKKTQKNTKKDKNEALFRSFCQRAEKNRKVTKKSNSMFDHARSIIGTSILYRYCVDSFSL